MVDQASYTVSTIIRDKKLQGIEKQLLNDRTQDKRFWDGYPPPLNDGEDEASKILKILSTMMT